MPAAYSGDAPFRFVYRDDLSALPEAARPFEAALHGGFAVDPEGGTAYFGMPGLGIVRLGPDLRMAVIPLPADLAPINFHDTRLMRIDGERRLVLPANREARVVVLDLEGRVEFVLPTPEFAEYRGVEFKPTSTIERDGLLYVADGYGANYISVASLRERRWLRTSGGKTDDRDDRERFGTAHGLAAAPGGSHLLVVDRSLDRIVARDWDGGLRARVLLAPGTRPCSIEFVEHRGRWVGATACLADVDEARAAPLLVLDGTTFDVLSTVRPAEDLGVASAQRLHHAAWYRHGETLFLLVQAWNPGRYFVLELAE